MAWKQTQRTANPAGPTLPSRAPSGGWPSVRLVSDTFIQGPWVFGRQVADPATTVADGDLVEFQDPRGRFLGHALYNSGSDIRLRVVSRGKRHALDRPHEFLRARIAAADRLRRRALRLAEHSDTYRVVHAEGDDLPGLVVDRLGDWLVCEYHSLGFWRLRDGVERALGALYPDLSVLHRVPKAAARAENWELPDEAAGAEGTLCELRERELRFVALVGAGHKTGWFCDQRENRVRIAELCRGRDVLDLCCNAGGFSMHARAAGARRVRGVDLDEDVLERARRGAALNGLDIEWVHADAFDVLRRVQREESAPEVIIVDPHKLIASRNDYDNGLRKYADLNALALGAVRAPGLVASFSCSGLLQEPAFIGMLFQAARRAERSVRLLSQMGAGADHPQSPDFSRSRYLKGALLHVE